MFRRLLVFLAASNLTLLLILTAVMTSAAVTFTPAKVKGWLRENDVYSSFVDGILEQSETLKKNDSPPGSPDSKNALEDPGIQAVAKKTLSPQFLQTTVETIIDSSQPWLEGKVPKPTFSIDITHIKNELADNIGAYAATRYAALPACPSGQPTDSTDILTISCKPAGYDPTPDIQKAVNDLKTSKDFLSTTTLTADNLFKGEGQNEQNQFETKMKNVPKAYRWARMTPIIFGTLSLVAITVIIMMSADRRRGIRRVAVSMYIAGLLLALEIYGASKAFNMLHNKLTESGNDNTVLPHTGIAVLKTIQSSLSSIVIIFMVGFLITAVALTVYLIINRTQTPKPEKSESLPLEKDPAVEEAITADEIKGPVEVHESAKAAVPKSKKRMP